MSVWADDNDEWCGGGMACDFGPKPCQSGVCRHYGRCMARDAEDAGQESPAVAGVKEGHDAQP
jgi:hypothetical protein